MVLWLGIIFAVFAEIYRTSSLSKSKELPSVAGVEWGVWLGGRALAQHSQGPQFEHQSESVCMLRLRAPLVEILCVHPGHLLPMWENISSFMLLLSDKYMPVALCLSSLTSKCALYGEKKIY